MSDYTSCCAGHTSTRKRQMLADRRRQEEEHCASKDHRIRGPIEKSIFCASIRVRCVGFSRKYIRRRSVTSPRIAHTRPSPPQFPTSIYTMLYAIKPISDKIAEQNLIRRHKIPSNREPYDLNPTSRLSIKKIASLQTWRVNEFTD